MLKMDKTPKKKLVYPKTYKNKRGVVFTIGDEVRLNQLAMKLHFMVDTDSETFAGRRIMKAKIKSLLPDVKGLVMLEKRLSGYWTWNVDDLENLTVK